MGERGAWVIADDEGDIEGSFFFGGYRLKRKLKSE
jgi:hypothetical protein